MATDQGVGGSNPLAHVGEVPGMRVPGTFSDRGKYAGTGGDMPGTPGKPKGYREESLRYKRQYADMHVKEG